MLSLVVFLLHYDFSCSVSFFISLILSTPGWVQDFDYFVQVPNIDEPSFIYNSGYHLQECIASCCTSCQLSPRKQLTITAQLVTARRCYWNLLKNEVTSFSKLPLSSYICTYRLWHRKGRRKTTGRAKSVKRVRRYWNQRSQVGNSNRFNRWKHIGWRQKICIGIIVQLLLVLQGRPSSALVFYA